MCLGVPMKIIRINEAEKTVTAESVGVKREVSTALLAEKPRIDDWVLVHVGYALEVLDLKTAEEILYVLKESGLIEDARGGLPK